MYTTIEKEEIILMLDKDFNVFGATTSIGNTKVIFTEHSLERCIQRIDNELKSSTLLQIANIIANEEVEDFLMDYEIPTKIVVHHEETKLAVVTTFDEEFSLKVVTVYNEREKKFKNKGTPEIYT